MTLYWVCDKFTTGFGPQRKNYWFFPESKYLRFTKFQREYGNKLQIVVAWHYISRYRASKDMQLCWVGDRFATGFGPQRNIYCFFQVFFMEYLDGILGMGWDGIFMEYLMGIPSLSPFIDMRWLFHIHGHSLMYVIIQSWMFLLTYRYLPDGPELSAVMVFEGSWCHDW